MLRFDNLGLGDSEGDWAEGSFSNKVADTVRAVRFMNEIVNASKIFRAARHPRSFVSLEGADHLLTGRNQARRAGRIISAWADPYLAA
jgi:hypothetical protein